MSKELTPEQIIQGVIQKMIKVRGLYFDATGELLYVEMVEFSNLARGLLNKPGQLVAAKIGAAENPNKRGFIHEAIFCNRDGFGYVGCGGSYMVDPTSALLLADKVLVIYATDHREIVAAAAMETMENVLNELIKAREV